MLKTSQSSEKLSDNEGEKTLNQNRTSVQDSAEIIFAHQGNSTATFYTLAMFAGTWKKEDGVNVEEAQGEEGGDFAQSNVDDNSPSKAEEDEKQGGDVADANADPNSLSSAEC